MITRVNHLHPIIALNGHLKDSWKYIRRIIFRDILKTQTSPLEPVVTLGLVYYKIIIISMIKDVEGEFNFFKENSPLKFLKNADEKIVSTLEKLRAKNYRIS